MLGPDASGKTTLAKKLDLPYYHFTKDSKYEDYLVPLCSLELTNAVLDRHIICEFAYSTVMHRQLAFTMKQWHNIILLTLIQNPVFVLCVRKPNERDYSKEQYMPYDQWDRCLALYRYFLDTHHIRYTEYDYSGPITPNALLLMHEKNVAKMTWWRKMWQDGIGCIGSVYPKVLLVAERLGPNNLNNIPFETGPTGRMLTDMLAETGTPLGKFAVTNLVKSYRRDTRGPNKADFELLREELVELKPEKVVFLGSVAKLGIRVAKELCIPHETMVHFGYWSHKGTTSISSYTEPWKKLMGII